MKNQELEKLRHSAAHLLAHAVKELYPKTKLTIGPATSEGFFYDFLPEKNFSQEDLPIIEKRMLEIANKDLPITHKQIPKYEARELYKDNPFKLELIDQIPGDTAGLAIQGDFYDLCRGGHVASTGMLKHFKLFNVSGSYWRADKSNQALQRITGTAFFTKEELDQYLKRKEESQKYDHRKLGKELDLFSFHEEGVGFPFFHAKGKTMLNVLTTHLMNLLKKYEYQEIQTPMMLNKELWKQSGHYEHYKENMFFCTVEDHTYAIKPMNCPGSILIYRERPHSYRELPLRLAENGLVHRFELSGVLHGLMRTRAFTIDDAHIYCTPDQIEQEIYNTINLVYEVMEPFGFKNITVGVSTKPESAMGSDELWEKATDALKNGLERAGHSYEIYEGEGAFYGPKIEFRIEDSMGRMWQCSTVQVDFFQSENFDLTYVSSEGTKSRPVIIHRAIYGSFERFFGILVEHFKGKFPFWLAPTQIKILTITDEQKEYASNIAKQLKNQDVRAQMDETSDPISGKIKRAQLEQVPWMLVIGNKEQKNNTATIRYLNGKQEFGISLEKLFEKITQENI